KGARLRAEHVVRAAVEQAQRPLIDDPLSGEGAAGDVVSAGVVEDPRTGFDDRRRAGEARELVGQAEVQSRVGGDVDGAVSGADVDETGCGTGGKAAVADSDEVDGPLVDGEPAREARLRVGNGDGVSSGGVGAGGENAG